MTYRTFAWAAAAVVLCFPLSAAADGDLPKMPVGRYVLDPHHASLIGSVSHFGRSTYVFRFDRFDASYRYDPATPDAAQVTVSIDISSLDTGWDKADKEFARDFMGISKTPMATFISTNIQHVGSSGTVTGDLTLNGVTKPVTLAVIFNGYGPLGPMGMLGTKAGFAASGAIKRSDFGLTKYLPMVGDDVTLQINCEFVSKD